MLTLKDLLNEYLAGERMDLEANRCVVRMLGDDATMREDRRLIRRRMNLLRDAINKGKKATYDPS